MDIQTIVKELDLEIARLESVKSLLTPTGASTNKPGRPTKAVTAITPVPAKARRQFSPEARAKIAAAQRARWARVAKAKKAA